MVDSTRCVATATDASHQVIGIITSLFLQELLLDLFADHRLQTSHHVGIGVRPYGRANDVIGVGGVTAPVTNRLISGIFQGHVAGGDRYHLGSQHLHLLHVGMLSFYVGLTHIDHALHVHQGTNGSGRHAMLSGTRLGDNPLLAHTSSDQDLTDRVVDLVCACVVEVFSLQIDLAAILLTESFCVIEWRGTSHVIAQQLCELLFEAVALHHL